MIQLGTQGHQEQIVTPDVTADHIGSGLVQVFATPMMIALMERTCHESIAAQLAANEGTVGTRIEVTHVAATPLGMRVWCDSELIETDRRRLTFRVRAYDECGLIGEGIHERFVIDSAKFQQKANSKRP